MCGIAGFIKTTKQSVLLVPEVLRDICYYNQLRGVDSLGLFRVDTMYNNKTDIIKDVGIPHKLLAEKKFWNWVTMVPGSMQYMVMHNRHATKGDKTNPAYAHPFEVKKDNNKGSIIMVHNGTLVHTNKPFDDQFKGKTDSQQLASAIASGTPLEDIEREIYGSWALVWHDSEDNTLHFWRNKERTLGFVHSERALWFGSELYSIANALDRRNVKVDDLVRLTEDEHWIWHTDENKFEKKKLKLKSHLSPKFSYAEYCETNLQDIFLEEAEKKGLSKSATTGHSYFPPPGPPLKRDLSSGKTAVEIFNPLAPANVGITPYCKPRVWPRSGRSKWEDTKTGLGMDIGAIATFSVHSHAATDRINQVKLDGYMVMFDSKSRASCDTSVEVHGMVSMSVQKVDEVEKLWSGVVCSIQRQWDSHKSDHVYRFMVKDITIIQMDDKFKPYHMMGKLPAEALKHHSPKSQDEKSQAPSSTALQTPQALITTTRKSEEREFADSKGSLPKTHLNFMQCSDCSNHFSPAFLQRVQKDFDDEASITIKLCKDCMRTAVADDSRMQRLFETERLHQMDFSAAGYLPEQHDKVIH